MTTISADPSTTVLSTSWMPLDGLIQQWGAFGAELAVSAPALHAVGMAFCALARETTARTYYTAAWLESQDGDLTDLEHALEELLQARQYWTDAMLSLELLLLESNEESSSQESLRTLVVEVMEQRMQQALLIHQTQQEQLHGYCDTRHNQQEGGETELACYRQGSRPASEKPETSRFGCRVLRCNVAGENPAVKKGSSHAKPMGR